MSIKNPDLTSQIKRDKAKNKGEINFQLSLNEEQKDAKRIILEQGNDMTVLLGHAGSGKTLLAVSIGLSQLVKGVFDNIIITRPTVTAGEDIGFLPGSLEDKLDPFLQPIYSNMYQLWGKENVNKLIEANKIEVIPFAFMRGRTFLNSLVIIDEAQNISHNQMAMAIGRLGKSSKMIICGDTAQIDLKNKKESGLSFLRRVEEDVKGFKIITLKENHRHEMVEKVLAVYDKYKD